VKDYAARHRAEPLPIATIHDDDEAFARFRALTAIRLWQDNPNDHERITRFLAQTDPQAAR
jgi:hypothetical protein